MFQKKNISFYNSPDLVGYEDIVKNKELKSNVIYLSLKRRFKRNET